MRPIVNYGDRGQYQKMQEALLHQPYVPTVSGMVNADDAVRHSLKNKNPSNCSRCGTTMVPDENGVSRCPTGDGGSETEVHDSW